MVTTVYGKCDGNVILFTRDETGRWLTAVPFSKDGEYVVELVAEDEAGNSTYLATILFTLDTKNLRFECRVIDVAAGLTVKQVEAMLAGGRYAADAYLTEPRAKCAIRNYSAKVINNELLGVMN